MAVCSVLGKVRTSSSNHLSKFWYFLYFSVLLLSGCYFILRIPINKRQEKCSLFSQSKKKREILVLLAGVTHRRNLHDLGLTK